MDIENNTNQDTRVKVTGGSGMAPYGSYRDDDDPSKWPLLPPGGLLSHSPLPPPWTICFLVNGRQVLKEVRHAASKVTLAAAGNAFRIDVE
jgi:hypothetical protein